LIQVRPPGDRAFSHTFDAAAALPVVLLFAAVLAVVLPASGTAAQELDDAVYQCLICHEDPDLTMELADGDEMSLHVDADTYAASVHGGELVCTDCHEGYEEDHPSGAVFESATAYKVVSYDLCRTCHFDTYTRTLESVHYELLQMAPEVAPVCTDCHGAHDIADPHDKQATLARSCATCHDDVFAEYAESVHGRALVEDNVQAVPACSDCHTAHSIEDPTTTAFHIRSPEICIGCHADEELMEPFGIPTTVASTYLTDFHGVTASLASAENVEERRLVVTCVDCHGVHDIAAPAVLGADAMKAKVEQVCADCHEGASEDFPAAWLSHFPPSLSHAPLVFLIDLFYRIFIPFMVVGLLLQVGLHLYRVAAHR
jgi:predicted CXXCH cytochrome family protein